jgi:mRNA interferase RelE/StbE
VTYAIIWDERAVSIASKFLADDSAGLAFVMGAVDLLSHDLRPAGSFPYGSDDLRRVHVGPYRVLYEIDSEARMITIIHVGRTA